MKLRTFWVLGPKWHLDPTMASVAADSGFPRDGGANRPGKGGGANIQFCQISPKNCMKLKEFGRVGARPKFYYEDRPLQS